MDKARGNRRGSTRSATQGPKSSRRPGGKRRLNPALARPVTPDAELAAIVGKDPLPRPQVIKKLWAYIKAEGLQDAKNRRTINADDRLRPVFGGKRRVDMFEMTKLVSGHLR
jgi:chromatin remodeling complex protein RSC6